MNLKLKLFSVFIFIVGALALLPGCFPSAGEDDEGNYEILPAERLMKRLEANRRKIKTFEGKGNIAVESGDFSSNAMFRSVLRKPDSAFVGIYGPFGIELVQVLLTGKDFVFFDALNNTAYSGKTDENVLENIFNVQLSFSDMIDAFVGSVNLTDVLYRQPDTYKVTDDKYILTYNDSLNGNTRTFHVTIRDLAITYYTVETETGVKELEAEYSGFQIIEGVAIPKNIMVSNKRLKQQIKLTYDAMSANKKDISIDFSLPEDVTKISW